MFSLLIRGLQMLAGLLLCGLGALGAFAIILITTQYAWGWVFLTGPAAVIAAILCLRFGTRLISAGIDGH